MITLDEFVFDIPLYSQVQDSDENSIISLLGGWNVDKTIINGYNSIEKCDTTYVLHYGLGSYYSFFGDAFGGIAYASKKIDLDDVHEVIFKCRRFRTKLHILVRIVENASNKYISKVGQYPSVADIHIGQVHKYDKVLPKDKMREFTKAIGLAANGVGIGSYVYLRRVFEHLVYEAVESAQKCDAAFDIELFNKSKMNEKIKMMVGYLPEFLVENYKIYGILSKGVHELSEDDCKKHFTVLRESIEMILDEKLERLQRDKRKIQIRSALDTISEELTKA